MPNQHLQALGQARQRAPRRQQRDRPRACADDQQTASAASEDHNTCECIPGTYSVEEGTVGTCAPCAPGWYRKGLGNDQLCLACPPGGTTFTSKLVPEELCIAQAGFFKTTAAATTFEQCAAGTFRVFDDAGLGICEPCLGDAAQLGMTSPPGSHTATNCYCVGPAYAPKHAPPLAPERCGCAPGLYWNINACEACPPGPFCLGTPPGGVLEATVPQPCPANSGSAAGSTTVAACVCDVAHFGSNDLCTACPTGTFKNVTGPASC